MHYHLILTEICNSKCKYCYEKSLKEFDNGLEKKFKFDFSEPEKISYSIKELKKFIQQDPNPILIFYGGEPLLETEKIKEIIDNLPECKFRMQTNAKLLDKLPFSYIKRIDKILISLDGNKQRTDFNRGEGTYDLVIKNLTPLKKQGYNGEIIARMTIGQDFPDIDKQVINLLNEGFTSIHWQLDVGFYKFDFDEKKIKNFFEEYNKNISILINYWIKQMHSKKVLMIYPFVGIMQDILLNKKTKLRCGAGYKGYAISPSGNIIACPIMNCITNFNAGNIQTSNPDKLKKFSSSPKCKECSYYDLCGGRCLYWDKAELWPKEGNELICNSIKHLIDELKSKKQEIFSLIKQGKISLKDFEYEKYFGPEIIP